MKEKKASLPFATLLKEFMAYAKQFKLHLIVVMVISIFSAIFTISSPEFLNRITNEISHALRNQSIDFRSITFLSIIYFLLIGSAYILSYVRIFLSARIATTMMLDIKNAVSQKINRLPLSYLDTKLRGDVMSLITNDASTIEQLIPQVFLTFFSSVPLIGLSVIIMFWYNVWFALAVLLVTLTGFVLQTLIFTRGQKYSVARSKHLAKLNAFIEETYKGQNILQAHHALEQTEKDFYTYSLDYYHSSFKAFFIRSLLFPIYQVTSNLMYVIICVMGILFIRNGSIQFGIIVAFLMYGRYFMNGLSEVVQGFSMMPNFFAAFQRIHLFLKEEDLPKEEATHLLERTEAKGEVEFDHISFSYVPEKKVISDFSAHIRPGQKVAIVGPTGAGKTTLINLLMRFYEVQKGSIRIDGIDIRDISRENLRSLFAMVLQDSWVFQGSLRENLQYNRPHLQTKEIYEACKNCGLEAWLRSLPNGLDTEIGEENALSHGQKQLLTIARAMLEDAPLLILDEATSSVDTLTEQKVQKAMRDLMQGRTSFIIAHRLSTIQNADLILVLKDGNIIEQGSHAELMAKQGFYTELYNSQFDEE